MKTRLMKVLSMVLMVVLLLTPATTFAKAKPKINKSSVTIYVGKTVSLKVKNNTKKVTWTSQNKRVASVNKKGKVTGKKIGTTYIFAKIKNGKKLKCKVTVKSYSNGSNSSSVGTNNNPANARNGVTVTTDNGTMYFKLLSTIRGESAINQLKTMGEWGEFQEERKQEFPNTTLTLFTFDVKAVNGYSQYPLSGLDVINPYGLYDGTCSKNINDIQASYLMNNYQAKDNVNLTLYNGASSKMYMALYVPNGMTSFSNNIFTKDCKYYWVRYTF